MKNNDMSSNFKILILLSGAYLILIIILFFSNLSVTQEMKPNEWGDFLAGTFAPLAFLWLVFGYRQQGDELRQNTIAIELQAKELKNSVEQQTALVEATKFELDLIQSRDNYVKDLEVIKAQPYFHFLNLTHSPLDLDNSYNGILDESVIQKLKFDLKNSRATCREINISIKSKYSSLESCQDIDLLEKNNDLNGLELIAVNGFYFEESENFNLQLKMTYFDENDHYQYQNFEIHVSKFYSEEGKDIRFKFLKIDSSFSS